MLRIHSPWLSDVRGDAVAGGPGAGEVGRRRYAAAARTSTAPDSTRRRLWRLGACTAVRLTWLPGAALRARRVHQPVAAHPHVVARLRQVGHDVAPAIVGHDDLPERRRQLGRFGDDPDAGFRPFRTGDHAADVVGVDRHGRLPAALSPYDDERGRNRHGTRDPCKHPGRRRSSGHGGLPLVRLRPNGSPAGGRCQRVPRGAPRQPGLSSQP